MYTCTIYNYIYTMYMYKSILYYTRKTTVKMLAPSLLNFMSAMSILINLKVQDAIFSQH